MPGQIYPSGGSVYLKFTTRAFSTGIPTTLAGSPVISIYKDDSLTQSTAGVTLTVDFDSVTGLNHVTIDTTADATFYANGHTFYLVITTGTVSSVSVVGEVVGNFDLAAAVVTAGNTLAVDGSGRVDVGKALGQAVTLDSNNTLNVSAKYWAGTAITATSIPVATAAGAAGGLFIAGSNAATTFASLTVTTTTTLTGAVLLSSTLGVTGATTFTGVVTATNGIVANITGNLVGTVSTLTTYTGNTPQTGDSYARIGATGSGLTSLAPSSTALSTATWTSGRAANLDNLDATISSVLAAVSNIAVTSAALNATAASATYTTGTSTGGAANTYTLDGVFDSVAAVGNAIDIYYEFDLSATTGAAAVGATWDGYLAGAVNTIKVYAYNWGGSSWDQIGNITGIAGTVVGAQEFDLTSSHTGTGGNLGKARIRFAATGLTTGTLKTDRILLGYAVVIVAPSNFSSLAITAAGGVTLADGVAHGGTPGSSTATFAGAAINITSAAGTAVTIAGGTGAAAISIVGGAMGVSIQSVDVGGTGLFVGGDGFAGMFQATGTDSTGLSIEGDGNGMKVSGIGTIGTALYLSGYVNAITATSAVGAIVQLGDGNSGLEGLKIIAGPASHAVAVVGGSSSGDGLNVTTAAGHAIFLAPTDGDGIHIVTALNSNAAATGISVAGVGTGTGLFISGNVGIDVVADNGNGIQVHAPGANALDLYASGNAVYAQSTNADAVLVYAGWTYTGLSIFGGQGSGAGISVTTVEGHAISLAPQDGDGIHIVPTLSANSTATGISVSGAGTGAAFILTADGGPALSITASNAIGDGVIRIVGSGGMNGIHVTVGDDVTTGSAIYLSAGSGDGVQIGASAHAVNLYGGNNGLNIYGNTGNAIGLSVGGSGYGIDGTLSPGTLASFFVTDSTKVYADAVDGSVVKEIAANAGGGSDPNVILSDVLGSQSLGDVDHIVLPSGPSDNGVLVGARLRITSGVAQYQERTIAGWFGTDKIAYIDQPFVVGTPTSGDSFEVFYDHLYQLDGSGNVLGYVQVFGFNTGALAQLFTIDSGQTYADAVSGSVVKETAGNATVSGTIDANVVQIGGVTAGNDVEQTGTATTFFGRMRQLYNRFFPEGPSGEVVKNSGTHTIVTKDSTGAVVTTQPFTDDSAGNETIGPAS